MITRIGLGFDTPQKRAAGWLIGGGAVVADLDSQETPLAARPDRGVGQAYLLLAICFYLVAAIAIPLQVWSPYLGIAATEVVLLVPAVIYVSLKRLPIAASLAWRPISPGMALAAVTLGVGGFGAATAIQLLMIPLTGRGPDIDLFNLDTTTPLPLKLICLVILPGVCEETLFRGAVQATLNRCGVTRSILITSLFFALGHLNPWNFVPLFLLSVVFGVVAQRAGSTVSTMIAHASTNAAAFGVSHFYGQEDNPDAWPAIAALSLVFVVALPIFLRTSRDQPARLGPLAWAPAGLSWTAIAISVACGFVLIVLLIVVAAAIAAWRNGALA